MEALNSLTATLNINMPVVFATVLLSWAAIKQLKEYAPKFPFRQVVPFISAMTLTVFYAWSVDGAVDKMVLWQGFVTALIAMGAYSPIKSFLKDRGIQF